MPAGLRRCHRSSGAAAGLRVRFGEKPASLATRIAAGYIGSGRRRARVHRRADRGRRGAVRPLNAAGLTALVGSVGRSEFGEAALCQNLENLDWLERTARAHHEVIETVAKERPVVPMLLATVYSSDEAAAGMLAERAADLRQALTMLARRSEWGVKAYLAIPDDGADGAAVRGLPPGTGRSSSP